MTNEIDQPLTRRGIPIDPELRVLAVGAFAVRFGGGAVMTTSAIFFTHQVGFSNAELAFSMGAAALLAMLVSLPAGHLGDTHGPREVLFFLMAALAVATPLPVLARSPWQLTVLLGIVAALQSSANAVRNGIVAQLAGAKRVLFKAYMRAVTNTALGLGAVFGGVALSLDQHRVYVAVFIFAGAMTAIATAIVRRLPHLPPHPIQQGETRLKVLRDGPFVIATLVTTVFSLHFLAAELGLVLFIAQRTEAPNVMVSVLLILNTAMVAAFQVRLSKGADTVPSGARHLRSGGLWILVGFTVIGLAQGVSTPVAIALLLIGATIHVCGEMIGSGGQWGISMGLAPHERQGQYQAFNSLGFSAIEVIGPPIVVLLCVNEGRIGWFLMGLIVFGSGLVAGPVARWALASRERYGVTTHSG